MTSLLIVSKDSAVKNVMFEFYFISTILISNWGPTMRVPFKIVHLLTQYEF